MQLPRPLPGPECKCEARQAAQRHGFFVYVEDLGGWVFPDRPLRRTRYQDSWVDKKVEDHTGEPYVWMHDCPFCGRTMRRDE